MATVFKRQKPWTDKVKPGHAYGVDVRDTKAVAELAAEIQKELGGLDVLVNNAGITRDQLLLRMSEEEVRKEFKEMEGDPHVKMHRRSLARQLVDQPVNKETKPVEDADMLVVNPTHFAVALLYRPEETPLPQLIVKGVDAEARALIERAKAARVPVIQCIWLARTIYREDVGGYIPRETLQAVAHIYRVLRELDDEAKGEVIEIPELNQR